MLGLAIKKAREEKGVLQSDLAKACKISSPLLSKIESGDIKNPSWRTVFKIANELDMNIHELLQNK